MITRILLHFVAILFFVTQTVHISIAEDNLIWMEADAPPFFIHEGKNKGMGYQDVVTDIFIEKMPDYSHRKITANVARHYQEFKAGENVCTTGFYKTAEREEFLYFSIPTFFTLPTVLVIKKERYVDFGGLKKVSLEDIIKTKNLLIGIVKDRSYGEAIDNVLQANKDSKNIFIINTLSLSRNLFEMLKRDRIDALIGLPEEAIFNAEEIDFKDQITTLTIVENQKDYNSWLSYAACSKTEWGKKTIKQINKILLKERPTARYRSAYERWLDESSVEGYRELYKAHFLTTGK